MPINVICPGCHTRFTVAEKYAGQTGPCPKCKKPITIPKPEDEVVIHAPEHSESGAVGKGGRHVLKTYRWRDTKFQPLMLAIVAGVVLTTLLVAIVLRGTSKGQPEWYILAVGAAVLGPAISWAGYTFLRDPELEAYEGLGLAIRCVLCGLTYALLWGVYIFIGSQWFGSDAFAKGLEIWQMIVLAVPVLAIGTGAAYVAFDLEPGSGFFHTAMYFAVTVLLRVVVGLSAIPGLPHGKGK